MSEWVSEVSELSEWSHSVMSDSLGPHGLQPTRLLHPWDFSRQEYWSGLPLVKVDNYLEYIFENSCHPSQCVIAYKTIQYIWVLKNLSFLSGFWFFCFLEHNSSLPLSSHAWYSVPFPLLFSVRTTVIGSRVYLDNPG